MVNLRSIEARLAKLVEAMPPEQTSQVWPGTSEQAIREVQKLLAEVEANPSAEVEPWNPADYSPEVVAMVEQMDRMQQTMVWSDSQGLFVEPAKATP